MKLNAMILLFLFSGLGCALFPTQNGPPGEPTYLHVIDNLTKRPLGPGTPTVIEKVASDATQGTPWQIPATAASGLLASLLLLFKQVGDKKAAQQAVTEVKTDVAEVWNRAILDRKPTV